MKATEAKLLTLMHKSPQFIIPIYQRTYSWDEKQCRQLWDDIIRAGSNDATAVHFIGSIVYVEQGLSQVTHQAPLLVIDGQQRLTTVSLLIEALARALGDNELVDGFSAAKLRQYYLVNNLENGDRFFKLLLTQTDSDSLKAMVRQGEQPKNSSIHITNNFDLFTRLISECKGNLIPVCRGLAKLVVVDIALTRDQDNPQLIFESMNSTGKELSQADLIRNYILMGLEPKLQTHLYEEYWRPMELDFGQMAYGSEFDSFMRHFLTLKTGEIPRIGDVYEAFKNYSRTSSVIGAGIEALVRDIRDYSRYYCAMALNAEKDEQLAEAFSALKELRVDVAYPFLLELYNDYELEKLGHDDFLSTVRLVEAYVFRRNICSIPPNSLNKTFATFTRSINKDRFFESVQAHFLTLPSYRRFPGDDEFKQHLRKKDVYNLRNRAYLLRKLENEGRKEKVELNEYTIEHIMPQNKELSDPWRSALGPDWERVHKEWLHTLGNLTLTGYNSEYSDRPFSEKRDIVGGFKQSPLYLNRGIGCLESWNESTIKERAENLSNLAVKIWAAPMLSDETLAQYQMKPNNGVRKYTINDHPNLMNPGTNKLFQALRKEILTIDPCVTEDFLKLYVAYKAETNFVDIIPMSKYLRLILNMTFVNIKDPKGICRDVTGLGRWGNGDIELDLKSTDEIPYVMGLIRQSYESQMGDDGH